MALHFSLEPWNHTFMLHMLFGWKVNLWKCNLAVPFYTLLVFQPSDTRSLVHFYSQFCSNVLQVLLRVINAIIKTSKAFSKVSFTWQVAVWTHSVPLKGAC